MDGATAADLVRSRRRAACLADKLSRLAELADKVHCVWQLENGPIYPRTDMGYAMKALAVELAVLSTK